MFIYIFLKYVLCFLNLTQNKFEKLSRTSSYAQQRSEEIYI